MLWASTAALSSPHRCAMPPPLACQLTQPWSFSRSSTSAPFQHQRLWFRQAGLMMSLPEGSQGWFMPVWQSRSKVMRKTNYMSVSLPHPTAQWGIMWGCWPAPEGIHTGFCHWTPHSAATVSTTALQGWASCAGALTSHTGIDFLEESRMSWTFNIQV